MYRLVVQIIEGVHRVVNTVESSPGHGLEFNQQLIQIQTTSRELEVVLARFHSVQALQPAAVPRRRGGRGAGPTAPCRAAPAPSALALTGSASANSS